MHMAMECSPSYVTSYQTQQWTDRAHYFYPRNFQIEHENTFPEASWRGNNAVRRRAFRTGLKIVWTILSNCEFDVSGANIRFIVAGRVFAEMEHIKIMFQF